MNTFVESWDMLCLYTTLAAFALYAFISVEEKLRG